MPGTVVSTTVAGSVTSSAAATILGLSVTTRISGNGSCTEAKLTVGIGGQREQLVFESSEWLAAIEDVFNQLFCRLVGNGSSLGVNRRLFATRTQSLPDGRPLMRVVLWTNGKGIVDEAHECQTTAALNAFVKVMSFHGLIVALCPGANLRPGE